MPRLNVAIVGAGLSGLMLGLALRKFAPDVQFELYESASLLSEVGAGINLWPRVWAIMQDIGLESVLLPLTGADGAHTVHAVYRKSDQAEGWGFDDAQFSETSYTVHRVDLQKALLAQIEKTHTVHLRKRLQSYVQPEDGVGPIELRFQDGTTATCDVLVGADGVRSAVRGTMYNKLADDALAAGKTEEAAQLRARVPATFSGFVTYRTLIHKALLSEEDAKHPGLNPSGMMMYCGKNKNMVVYPISQGRIINIVAVVSDPEQVEGSVYKGPWVSSATKDEIAERFKGWEPDVQEIVKHIQEPAQRWVVNVVNQLPTYVQGRVALVGDAAHSMCPTQGAGAGQCFEDIYQLSRLLSRADVTKENVSLALQVFDETRRPFSQNVAALSYLSGKTMHFNMPQYADLTEEASTSGKVFAREQLRETMELLKGQWTWRQGPTVAEDTAVAFRKLDEVLSKA